MSWASVFFILLIISSSGLNHLIYVNISGMSTLETIGEGTFVHLAAIEVITCKNNPNLTVFDLGSLKGLTYLREVCTCV
jgi:hypothetical protein